LRDLFGGERATAARAWQNAEHFFSGFPEAAGFSHTRSPPTWRSLLPASSPDADAVTFAVQTLGDHLILAAGKRQQDDLRSLRQPLRARPDHSLATLPADAPRHRNCTNALGADVSAIQHSMVSPSTADHSVSYPARRDRRDLWLVQECRRHVPDDEMRSMRRSS